MMNPRRFESSSVAICIGMATLMCGGSCSRHEEGVPPPSLTTNCQTLDEDVIEAALVDFATRSDGASETLQQEQGKGRVIFSGKSRDWVGTLRQELSAESEAWRSMGSTDRNDAKGAGANVIRRVEGKHFFAAFRPKDPRLSVWEDAPESTQPAEPLRHFNKPRPIHAAPPGYSDQCRLAVVAFSFSSSMHSGDATYVLKFDGKKWNVVSRHFAYYV